MGLTDKKNIELLTWNEFDKMIFKLFNDLKSAKYESIIAIQRGGLVPAVCLSHLLNIRKCFSITVTHSESDDIFPIWKRDVELNECDLEIKNKHILIIDDIVGTGKTLKKTVSFCQSFSPLSITTACLFIDSKCPDDAIVDYKLVYSDKWIVFPWERNER